MKLTETVDYLNELLSVETIKDYPGAVNGLQVENSGKVERVGVAVDACEEVMRMAAAADVDLLIVHHGLFWRGLGPVTGPSYRKLKIAFDTDMAVYSVHLPLDVHPELGNNAQLCMALDLDSVLVLSEEHPDLAPGLLIETEISREILHSRIEQAVKGAVNLAAGGPVVSRRIAIITGGAASKVEAAAAAGVDTLITGEGSHWTYTAAEELGVNLFYAGHYATETFGVKALAAHLEEKFGLPWEFFDHPTGL